jgi:hypothetical protein
VTKPQAETWPDIHARALENFKASWDACWEERAQCLEDRRFICVPGAQWEGPLELQYENKPRLEVDKIALAVTKICNEYRNNRVDVMFAPKNGEAADELADACAARYRADEADSCAEDARDNAFDEGVMGGFGAWRLRSQYEDDADSENEYQCLRWEAIYEADQYVFFDANARRHDKSDAKHACLLTPITRAAYKAEYGDDPSSWPIQRWDSGHFQWCTPDLVFLCEYYEVEQKRDVVEVWASQISGDEERHLKSKLDASEGDPRYDMEVKGYKLARTKKIKRPVVHKWLLNGNAVLEDCGLIPGEHIPIIPFYGKRRVVDEVERCTGHVRKCKDSQRLKNVQLSKLAEISGKSSVEKPIMFPEQIAGHEVRWSEDNIKDYPYLLINPIYDANGQPIYSGAIGFTKPPVIPEALAALLQITETDIKEILGNQEQGESVEPNISGKVIELVQARLDMQTSGYIENMKKACKRAGEVWLSAAKDIYVEEGRKLKGITNTGDTVPLVVGKITVSKSGKTVAENDFSKANFECRVDVGPATASRKQSVVRSMANILQVTQDPQDQQVITATMFANMEGEGLGDLRKYYRKKMLKLGVAQPTEAEKVEMDKEAEGEKPDANTEFLQASARQADAEAKQATANVVLKVAQAGKTEAERVKIESETDQQQQSQGLEIIDRVAPNLLPGQPQQSQPQPQPTGA